MPYSTVFSKYYDSLMGDYTRLLNSVHTLINTYGTKKKNLRILELACGTGTILKTFPHEYELYGLDIAKDMIAIAKEKVPHAKLRVGDMTDFSYAKKFDVIICIFDSINHLTKFSQWEKVFQLAAQHLESDGIFIFDMNTTKRLYTLSTFKIYAKRLDQNTIALEKFSYVKPHTYNMRIVFLKNTQSKKIETFEENVKESVYDRLQVRQAVMKYFIIEKLHDPFRSRVTKNTGRIFFVCKKKA